MKKRWVEKGWSDAEKRKFRKLNTYDGLISDLVELVEHLIQQNIVLMVGKDEPSRHLVREILKSKKLVRRELRAIVSKLRGEMSKL